MNSEPLPLSSILVKPAGPDCNMSCAYCFYLDRAGLFPGPVHRMSDEVLEELVRAAMGQSAGHASFGWQGGEPTLMGLPFFEKAVTLQNMYGSGKSVGNGLQTNGILLDSRWAAFLRRYRFLVGLSIDGPREIHDHYRRLRGGQDTWSTVVDRAKMLLDAGVDVNALSVVTEFSAPRVAEIYRFLKELGLRHMQFIPGIEPGRNDPARPGALSVSPETYGDFLVGLFDLWLSDIRDGVAHTSVRFFDSLFHTYVGLSAPDCTLAERCGTYLVVEHNGDVFSCDFFVEHGWKLGNLLKEDLVGLLNSPRQREFGALKASRPTRCRDCPWLRRCYGGCTNDRVRDPGGRAAMRFCASYRKFFAHADRAMRDLASDWMRRQRREREEVQAMLR